MKFWIPLALVLSSTSALAADTEAKQTIEYRELIFEALGKHMKALGTIVKGKVNTTDDIAGHARSIEHLATMIPRSFPAGTGPDSGHHTEALPAIWKDWAGFEAAAKTLQTEAATLATMAEAGKPMGELAPQFGKVGKACGSCHDSFREDDEH